MNSRRTVEDILREEYFILLAEMRKAAECLEADIRFILKSLMQNLKSHQRIEIVSRVKECESAIKSLQRRQELSIFDGNKNYTLKSLKDLAGVRILFFQVT